MANFATLADVVEYALFRAGEFTTGQLGDGDFYNGTDGGPVLGYINDVIEGLLLGSPLGLTDDLGRPMPGVDWWWARKQPNAVLQLKAPMQTGTVSITKGERALVFSNLLAEGGFIVGQGIVGQAIVGGTLDLAGYRIRIGSSSYLPRIISTDATGTHTEAVIDGAWPDETQTNVAYTAFKLEYDLPDDFLRFSGEPTLSQWPYKFPVMDESTLAETWPIAATAGGQPQAAALIGPKLIRLSHYPLDLERVEFPYIYLPDSFAVADQTNGRDLILPEHYRRILGLGAAYYVCYDKADTKAGDLKMEFAGMYRSMLSEHMRHQRKMSKGFGRFNYRLGQVKGREAGPLRTSSGLIIG